MKQNARRNKQHKRNRDKNEIKRLAKRALVPLKRIAYREARVSPDYYDVVFKKVRIVVENGRRVISTKSTLRIKPNAKYHDLIRQLIESAREISVLITEVSSDE